MHDDLRTRAGPGVAVRSPVDRVRRNLTASAFVGAVSQGLYLTCGVLFVVRWLGLTGSEVGLAMSIATGTVLVTTVPAGRLVDHVGGRRVAAGCASAAAAALVGYSFASSYATFLAATVALTGSIAGLGVAQNALVGTVLDGGDRTRFKARQRSVRNIGMALGTLLAAVPLQVDVKVGYQAALLVGAVAMAAVGWLAVRLPVSGRRIAGPPAGLLGALRDLPYMATALVCGVIAMRFSFLTVALPLWITEQTIAPHYLLSVTLLLNTALVVLCQVRVATWAGTTSAATRCNTAGCLLLACSCMVFAVSGAVGTIAAVAIVLTGLLIFTVGEMLTSAAAWTFAFDFTRDDRHGEYQAAFALGNTLGALPGPMFAAAAATPGLAGWGLGAVVFVAAGVATAASVAWAGRTTDKED